MHLENNEVGQRLPNWRESLVLRIMGQSKTKLEHIDTQLEWKDTEYD